MSGREPELCMRDSGRIPAVDDDDRDDNKTVDGRRSGGRKQNGRVRRERRRSTSSGDVSMDRDSVRNVRILGLEKVL